MENSKKPTSCKNNRWNAVFANLHMEHFKQKTQFYVYIYTIPGAFVQQTLNIEN
jgi:hypothetical protein